MPDSPTQAENQFMNWAAFQTTPLTDVTDIVRRAVLQRQLEAATQNPPPWRPDPMPNEIDALNEQLVTSMAPSRIPDGPLDPIRLANMPRAELEQIPITQENAHQIGAILYPMAPDIWRLGFGDAYRQLTAEHFNNTNYNRRYRLSNVTYAKEKILQVAAHYPIVRIGGNTYAYYPPVYWVHPDSKNAMVSGPFAVALNNVPYVRYMGRSIAGWPGSLPLENGWTFHRVAHPHIDGSSGGDLCLGTELDRYQACARNADLLGMATVVNELLPVYWPGSPYNPLERQVASQVSFQEEIDMIPVIDQTGRIRYDEQLPDDSERTLTRFRGYSVMLTEDEQKHLETPSRLTRFITSLRAELHNVITNDTMDEHERLLLWLPPGETIQDRIQDAGFRYVTGYTPPSHVNDTHVGTASPFNQERIRPLDCLLQPAPDDQHDSGEPEEAPAREAEAEENGGGEETETTLPTSTYYQPTTGNTDSF